jgi:hypothetical protein
MLPAGYPGPHSHFGMQSPVGSLPPRSFDDTIPSLRKIAERRFHLFFLVGAVVGIVLGVIALPLMELLPDARLEPTEVVVPRVANVEGARGLFVFPPTVVEERALPGATSDRVGATPAAAPIVVASPEPARLAAASKRPRSSAPRSKAPKTEAARVGAGDLLSAGL